MRSHASRQLSTRFTPRRLTAAALALSAVVAAGACSRSRTNEDAALAADLQHDLELASTTGIELAGSRRGGTQVVSAVEGGPKSTPMRTARAKRPKATGHRRHAPSPKVEEPSPAPEPESADAATVVAAAGHEVEHPAPATEQAPQPVSLPSPVSWPDGGWGAGRGRGNASDNGIGAILRGGVVGGIDDCDERDHSRNRRRASRIASVVGAISGPALGRVGLPSGTTFPHR